MNLKSIVKKLPFVSNLAKFYREKTKVIEILKPMDIEKLLIAYSKKITPLPFFVVVGANEGIQNDHLSIFIRSKNWPGLLIEPVESTFHKLVKNFEGLPNLIFKNVGISNVEGELPIYKFSDKVEGKEYHQLFSFDRAQLEKLEVPDNWKTDHIIEEKVKVYTLSGLLEELGISNVNILQIDTEGYDYKVLQGIEFKNTKPDILIYEHCHLGPTAYYHSIELLRKNGYYIFGNEFDTIALTQETKTILGY
jgi:FkbM family methyltransferase